MTKKIKCTAFVVLGLFVITAGFLGYKWFHTHAKKPQHVPNTLVTVSHVTEKRLSRSVTATGNIIAIQNTQLSPKVSGYVTQIYYNEGDTVTTGQTLVQLDNRHERNAVATALASFNTSKIQMQRDARLLKRGFIMQDTYHTDQVSVETNQALLEKAQDDLADKVITAPFSGAIGAREISVGDFLNAGNPITTLVDQQDLKAIYTVPASYQAQLKLGQDVLISNDDSDHHYIAHASYIAPVVDPTSQTIEVHAKLSNTGNTLKPGQFVSVKQILAQQQVTLVIPMISAIPSLSGYYVYTIKDNRAIKKSISIGQRYDTFVEVTSGLKNGERIIVGGIDKIHPGSIVKTV